MAIEFDVRDTARRRPVARSAAVAARAVAPAAGDLPAAARQRGRQRNVLSGTRAVLAAPAPAAGALVDRALASMAALGGPPLDFVPDPDVVHTSAGTAVVHLHQHHRGIPVYEAVRSVHFRQGDGEIVGDHVVIEGAVDVAPGLSAADAVMAAARYLAGAGPGVCPDGSPLAVSKVAPRLIASFPLPSRPSLLAKRPFAEPVTAHLVLLCCDSGDTRLGWLTSLVTPGNDEQYDLIVAANGDGRGEILYCKGSYRSARGRGTVFLHNPDDPGGRAAVDLPLPRAAYPAFGLAVATDAFGGPWISADSTRGNNAAARRGNRKATLQGARQDGAVVFEPADPQGEDQRLLNAFYYCNYLHDFFALLGFGEAEGNFQQQNLSGVPGDKDALEVRVFDGAVEGTGRMRSRRDGRAGEMHLGLRDGRHGALDADLVFHELVHGVSNRLAGGRMSFEPLRHPESRALGEGISDYFALTIQSHSSGRDKTVFGAWLGRDAAKGLRRQAYDEPFPLHFGDLADPDHHEPHHGGEIWCMALMRLNRSIGAALGDPGRGHEIGWQLVVDSLKLLPVGADQPGFLDARDAITRALADLGAGGRLDAADHAAVEGALLRAFARTGMGPGARGRGAHFEGIVADFTGAGEAPFDPPQGDPP